MSRIEERFERLRERGQRALVTYLTAGDPDIETSYLAAVAAVEHGADILELGIPFSDPLADGPVIQEAMVRARDQGVSLSHALELCRRIRDVTDVPIVLFGYLNPWFGYGPERSIAMAKEAGADGLLVVDLPFEEADPWRTAANQASLSWIHLVTPTTEASRAAAIARVSSGFVYMVSMTGVTGGALGSLERLRPVMAAVKNAQDVPVCLGFGVRDRASAAKAAEFADGVVVGSALVKALQEGAERNDAVAAVAKCVRGLRQGVDEAMVGT